MQQGAAGLPAAPPRDSAATAARDGRAAEMSTARAEPQLSCARSHDPSPCDAQLGAPARTYAIQPGSFTKPSKWHSPSHQVASAVEARLGVGEVDALELGLLLAHQHRLLLDLLAQLRVPHKVSCGHALQAHQLHTLPSATYINLDMRAQSVCRLGAHRPNTANELPQPQDSVFLGRL